MSTPIGSGGTTGSGKWVHSDATAATNATNTTNATNASNPSSAINPMDPTERIEPTYAAEPERNFAAVRLAFVILLIAAVILPVVYVSIALFLDLGNRRAAAADATQRVARIAEEHAIKVFDLNQGLNERVSDLLGNLSDAAIIQREHNLHERLKKLGGGYPQVASVSVWGANNRLLVNSLVYPSPNLNFSGRSNFGPRSNGVAQASLEISPLLIGNVTQAPVFNTSMQRWDTGVDASGTAAGGAGGSTNTGDAKPHYRGIVSVALRAQYFYNFYKELAGNDQSMAIGLVREDGTLLVHYSPNAVDVQEEAGGAGRHFQGLLDMLNRMVSTSKNGAGNVTIQSSGGESIVSYRRVGDYPAYVYVSYPSSAIVSAWLSHVSLLVTGVFIPCLVLWGVILVSLRRLALEERRYVAWRADAATRRSVEAAFRHARRMQALGNLVGNVAHDFNNLLMTMSANAQVVRRRGLFHIENEMAAIERAIKSGQGLTRQLLGVARKQPQRTEWIVLQTWLPAAQTLLASTVGASADLAIDVDPMTWPIRVDPAEMELALMNLAMNARDAMGSAEEERTPVPSAANAATAAVVEGAAARISARVVIRADNLHLGDGDAFAHAGDYVCLSVSDNGIGMTQEVLNRAFEPLFTTKPQGMGTGLGLSQVSGFCAQSGGTATLESQPGAGTTVRLYLPRAEASSQGGGAGAQEKADASADATLEPMPERIAVPHETSVMAPAVQSSISILLVEDNPEVAAGTEALLSVMGHRIRWAENADLAYAELTSLSADPAATLGEGFDMVLSDVHMPGTMNGIDLALRLRTTHPGLPVVLVTGYASELERARQAKIPVLAKPFDVEALEALIEQASSKQRQA